VKPLTVLQRCAWCGRAAGGFYCIQHNQRRRANDARRHRLEQLRSDRYVRAALSSNRFSSGGQ